MTCRPYWITIEGRLGVGVTAQNDQEALAIAAPALGTSEARSVTPISTLEELDQRHVVPNMGNWLKRGIWFPQGFGQ